MNSESPTPFQILEKKGYIKKFKKMGFKVDDQYDEVIVRDREWRYGFIIKPYANNKFAIWEFMSPREYTDYINSEYMSKHSGSIKNVEKAAQNVLEAWLYDWIKDSKIILTHFRDDPDVLAILQTFRKEGTSTRRSKRATVAVASTSP